jgi:DNA-binding transcriptional LysR family regulator
MRRPGCRAPDHLKGFTMSIDLKQLKYFLAVAEEKSFSRAAERLHISQPPLSQQIQKLESELGVRLFARTTRSFELTVAGKALMTEAADLLARMRMTIDTIRQIDRGEVGRLRVGIVGSAMWGPIPKLLEEFQSRFPRVSWTVHELGPNDQYDALRAKQIDVGFWREPRNDGDNLKHDHLRQELCFRENVCVAVNHQHRLASRPHVELADLAQEPLLTLALDKSAFARHLIQSCVDAGFEPAIYQEASEPQTVLAMVGAGLGVALMPETTARVIWPGVVFVPIKTNPPSANLYITYPTQDDAPVIRAFLKILNPAAE